MKNENQIRTQTARVSADGYVVIASRRYDIEELDTYAFANYVYDLTLWGYKIEAEFSGNEEHDEALCNFMAAAELVVTGEWPSAVEDELNIPDFEIREFRDVNAAINDGSFVPSDDCVEHVKRLSDGDVDFDDEDSVRENRVDILVHYFYQLGNSVREKFTEEVLHHLGNVTESARSL